MRYDGPAILDLAEVLGDVYADVFSRPAEIRTRFVERLQQDAHRPGFRAITVAAGDSPQRIEAFASGWITQAPFRSDRAYGAVAAQLGTADVTALLIGALEVDELAVRAERRGTGLGRRLLDELVTDAPRGRAWLLTAADNHPAIAFYRRVGWQQYPVTPGGGDPVTVFYRLAAPRRDDEPDQR
jgi:ribosomal protein S18 acetylase RimI-like enzyme